MQRLKSIALIALQVSRTAPAQHVPSVSLPGATGRITEDFTSIYGVRELADGRVLVSDERDSRVVVADFATGKTTVVGRTGSGPGEYRRANSLYALSGDSTLMPEDNGGSWILFSGATVSARLTPDRSIGSSHLAMIGGFDTRGNALILTTGTAQDGGLTDSLSIQLHARATHQEQSLGRARSPYGRAAVIRGSLMYQRRSVGEASSPAGFYLMDRPILFPDGWVATARLQPYRVDWRAPDGTITIGPIIAAAHPYDDRDKVAYLQREATITGKPPRDLGNVTAWPDMIPAFDGMASPVLGAPDGKLWIARTLTAAEPGNRYDIVDRRGALVGVLMLAVNQRVVGFGAKSVYVAVTDDDGIQRLQRHPRP